MNPRRRSDVFWLLAIAAVLTVAFADLIVLDQTLYSRDIAREYYPSRRIFHDIVRGGELPLWNPHYSGGQPFAANPGYQVFYPIAWLTLLLPSFHVGFHLEVLLHYFIAALGMYLFVRSCRGRPWAAALGALSWSLGGLLVSLSTLLPFLFSAAWLPFVAWSTRRFFRARTAANFALAALFLGLIVLCGEQSMMLQAGAMVGAYALYSALKSGWRSKSAVTALGLTAAITIVATLIGAAAIFPALDLQRDTGRAEPLPREEVMSWSMSPVRPLELIFPNAFGRMTAATSDYWAGRFHAPLPDPWLVNTYPGLLLAVFAIAGVVARMRGWKLFASVTIASYLVAIGAHGPIFPILHALGLRSIRYPEKFWIVGVFAITAFGAIAIGRARIFKTAIRVLALIAAITIALPFFAQTSAYERLFESIFRLGQAAPLAIAASRTGWVISAVTAAVCVLALLMRRRVSRPVWIAALAIILLADLLPRTYGLMRRTDRVYFEPPPLARSLGQPHTTRIYNAADWMWLLNQPPVPASWHPWFVRNALSPRLFAAWQYEGVLDLDITKTNLHPSREFSQAFFTMAMSGRRDREDLLLKLSGATHRIDALPLREWKNRGDLAQLQPVIARPIAGAERYYFADQIVETHGLTDFMRHVAGSEPLSPRVAFVPRKVHSGSGTVDASHETANTIRLDVTAADSALLVLAITPHRYWRAAIDGAIVETLPANIGFQAVQVPRGRHRIELVYRNPIVTTSIVISIVAAIALAVTALWPIVKAAPVPRR